jgi:hypothetical protein
MHINLTGSLFTEHLSAPAEVETGSHIMAVFSDPAAELKGALEFLKPGLKRDVIMIITDFLTKDELLDKMSQQWHVDARKLEREGDIIVKSTAEWYFPDGNVDPQRLAEKWKTLVSLCLLSRNKGLRVYGSTSGFFNAGLASDLVRYESSLTPRFDIRIKALCGYMDNDMNTLSSEQVAALIAHHNHLWLNTVK